MSLGWRVASLVPASPPPPLPFPFLEPIHTHLPPLVAVEAHLLEARDVGGEHAVLVLGQPPHVQQQRVPLEQELRREGGRGEKKEGAAVREGNLITYKRQGWRALTSMWASVCMQNSSSSISFEPRYLSRACVCVSERSFLHLYLFSLLLSKLPLSPLYPSCPFLSSSSPAIGGALGLFGRHAHDLDLVHVGTVLQHRLTLPGEERREEGERREKDKQSGSFEMLVLCVHFPTPLPASLNARPSPCTYEAAPGGQRVHERF